MRRIPLRAHFCEIVRCKLIIIICIYDNGLENKDLQYVQSCCEKWQFIKWTYFHPVQTLLYHFVSGCTRVLYVTLLPILYLLWWNNLYYCINIFLWDKKPAKKKTRKKLKKTSEIIYIKKQNNNKKIIQTFQQRAPQWQTRKTGRYNIKDFLKVIFFVFFETIINHPEWIQILPS